MSVSFKFANAKIFDSIPIAGTVCKLADLKLRIAEKKKMVTSGNSTAGLDFDYFNVLVMGVRRPLVETARCLRAIAGAPFTTTTKATNGFNASQ